jgi:hypothetical protein
MLHNQSDFKLTIAARMRENRRLHDLDAIDALIGALEDYRTQLHFKQHADFQELRVCDAIADLFDDGDVTGRREAILEENRWDEHGNPLRGDLYNDGERW